MTPTTYLTPSDLSALRRRLADEIVDRRAAEEPMTPDFAQYASDVAGDICRPDMGGAYLGNVQSRADARGLRAELDAAVERMALSVGVDVVSTLFDSGVGRVFGRGVSS